MKRCPKIALMKTEICSNIFNVKAAIILKFQTSGNPPWSQYPDFPFSVTLFHVDYHTIMVNAADIVTIVDSDSGIFVRLLFERNQCVDEVFALLR